MRRVQREYKEHSYWEKFPIKIRNHFSRIVIGVLTCICGIGIFSSPVLANPMGGEVAAGAVTITRPSANHLQINQTSQTAIINWQSFNIGQHQLTHFQQPAGGVALNRINPTQGVSAIYGRLTATGKIILINPAGIFFGPSAFVNVGSLIASTANITDADFLNGKYNFAQSSSYSGSVINQGSILAARHGLVALIGDNIQNNGLIQADLGNIILATGNAATITFAANQLIGFVVTVKSAHGGSINNTGTLRANGGRIIVSANTASNVLDNVINLNGIVQATSVRMHHGEIILSANGGSGVVNINGKLNVSGRTAKQHGGNITITGSTIFIGSKAVIDASGSAGGGTILIGGDLHGAGTLTNAFNLTVEAGALIKADALINGNGGTVVLWSDGTTDFAGNISAIGGGSGGNGGFAEVSGHQLLNFNGTVNLSAAQGVTGTLLLDPENLTIQAAGPTTATNAGSVFTSNVDNSILTVADLQAALANANVLVQTGSGGLQAGDITVADNISWSNLNTLTLSAYRNININATITNSAGGHLNLNADNTGTGIGTIIFSAVTPQINFSGSGAVNFYYNPASFPTPTNYAGNVNVSGGTTFIAYMLVNNVTNLQNINNNLSGNYALGTNIDASATLGWNAGAGFVPIGTIAASFTGQFDGQNHTINGLSIALPLASDVGLFGYVNTSGMIQNVGLTNMTITGLNDTGSLIGYDAAGGAVNNVYSTGSVTSAAISSYIGGLIGFSNDVISNSYTTATVLAGATSNYVGGLVGEETADIINSYHASGSVTAGAASDYVGGLVGYNEGSVSHAYNTGAVGIGATGSAYVGGLIGYSSGNVYYSYSTGAVTTGAAVTNVGGLIGYSLGTINNSYSTGAIVTGATGTTNVGGLVGYAGNNVTNSYSMSSISAGAANNNLGGLVGQNNAIISNSYSTGSVAAGAGSTFLGGLVGLNNASVVNSFWDINTSAQLASAGGTGETTAAMMQQATFCPSGNCGGDLAHFDFVNNWGINNGTSYPFLLLATLTYTANTSSMTYGGAVPAFTGTITGFVGGETLANATLGNLVFTSSATSVSNVGSYAINGSGLTANSGNYLFAQATVNATALTINPATLTYNANAGTMTYGGSVPAFSGTVTGFVNSQTQTSATTGTLAFSSAATANSNVGSYAINGSGLTANNGNYVFTQAAVNGTALTINPATLTYNANAGTMTYGGSVPAFSGTVTGFVNSQTQTSATTGTLAFSSAATANSNVGSYAINGSGLTANNGNYVFTQALGNATALTINPATLTYNANAGTMTYGGSVPAFSGTVTGFVNSQTQTSATTGTLAFSSSATANSNVGSYAINGSGLTANNGNYVFTQAAVNGTALTINPAILTYNANAGTMTSGGAVPAFSGTVTGFVNSQTQASATTGTLTFTSPATSSSNPGIYAINGSGLTANNGNYIFTQATGNAVAFTITPSTIIPVSVVIAPSIVTNILPVPPLALIADILNPSTNRNNYIAPDSTGLIAVTIINNTDAKANTDGVIIESNNASNLAYFTTSNIVSSNANNGVISPGISYQVSLNPEDIQLESLNSFLIDNSWFSITALILLLITFLIAMEAATAIYALYMYIWDGDIAAARYAANLPGQYEGALVASGMEIRRLLSNALPIDYTITTNFVFTGASWVIVSQYRDSVMPKRQLRADFPAYKTIPVQG